MNLRSPLLPAIRVRIVLSQRPGDGSQFWQLVRPMDRRTRDRAVVGGGVLRHSANATSTGTFRAVPHGIMPERYGIVGGRPIDAHWHFGTT